ncbi:hypothetical protein AB0K00_35575 [Dactylosporangium sp. NPDC049525]|uniref:hypothetical protein n=1 Tax=Dactylosporangium sp. NPDC049525 TaxID=3154730 RepID=UPI0034400FB0
MARIRGQAADENDNNPVEVRHAQILGSDLTEKLGRFPDTRVMYRWLVGVGYIHWQYFPRGIIISSPNSCARVLYGPLYDYWDNTGQFDGPLGAPTSDVLRVPDEPHRPGTPPPPPRGTYAVFENGVLFLDPNLDAAVTELSPVAASMVERAAGFAPDGAGIARGAQATIDGFTADALVASPRLADNVEHITTRVTFAKTGPGGCTGASFNAPGRSLLRSHIFNVHMDFDLKGCAGVFGDASADLRIEVRLFAEPTEVAVRLVSYSVDGVSSPYSIGDRDIRDGLSEQLNRQFSRNLLRQSFPEGIVVLAGVVMANGDVNLYIAPLCAVNSVMSSSGGEHAASTVGTIRRLRDTHLITTEDGRTVTQLADLLGPVALEAIRRQQDAPELKARIARLLNETFTEDADLEAISASLAGPVREIAQAVQRGDGAPALTWLSQIAQHGLSFIRDELTAGASFQEAVLATQTAVTAAVAGTPAADRLREASRLLDQGVASWSVPEQRPEAFVAFDEALDLVRGVIAEGGLATSGPTFVSWVHWPIGEMLRIDGQHAKAGALAEEALTIARRLGQPASTAGALLDVGVALWGVPERRADVFIAFDEALDLVRGLIADDGLAVSGPTFVSWVHWPIGEMLRIDGQHEKAGVLAEEALAIARRLGQPASIAGALLDVGVALWGVPERRADVFVAFDEALDLVRRLIVDGGLAASGPTFVSWMHWPIGEMLRIDGQHEKAGVLAEEALAIARRLGQPASIAGALLDVGVALWGVPERRADVFVAFDEALDLVRRLIADGGLATSGPTFVSWVHWPIGEMLRIDGQQEKADALDEEARAIARRLGTA